MAEAGYFTAAGAPDQRPCPAGTYSAVSLINVFVLYNTRSIITPATSIVHKMNGIESFLTCYG